MAKQGVLLGIDSLMWRLCHRFIEEGKMPNLYHMFNKGYLTELLPTMPPLTGGGWTTIASGAWPSTTGVEGHFVHYEGEPFYQLHRGYDSRVVHAERIWETVEKSGLKPMLLKYPVSWPTSIKNGFQYSGCGGYADQDCPLQIAHVRCFTNDKNAVDVKGWSFTPVDSIKFKQADGWNIHEKNMIDALETEITITPERGGKTKHYFILVALDAEGAWKVWLSTKKDLKNTLCCLSNGEWSDWLEDDFFVNGKSTRGYFKVKLIDLAPRAKRFKLYFSSIHDTNIFSVPQRLSNKIYQEAGPFWEEIHVHDLPAGWIDDDTWLEICEQHTETMIKTINYMMSNLSWNIFCLQYHPIDYALHVFWSGIDPNFPGHDPNKFSYYWELVGRFHKLADLIIGTILENIDNKTVMCVVGDHGHTQWHTTLSLNNLLALEGFINIERFEGDNALVNWNKTKAFCDCGVSIFLNVKGRDPQGCVNPGEEYEQLRNQIIELLYNLKDPETSERIIELAIKKESARSFGLYGGGIGDVVFAMRPGYRTIIRGRDGWDRNFGMSPGFPVFTRRKPFIDITSEHGQFPPWNPELYTMAMWSGPGVKKVGQSSNLGRLVDVAPTFCHLTGVPFPKNCEGSILFDVLQDDRKRVISTKSK